MCTTYSQYANDASFVVVDNKFFPGYVSFLKKDSNGMEMLLRNNNNTFIRLQPIEDLDLYRKEASFRLVKLGVCNYTAWSDWSPCSATCHSGDCGNPVKTRKRVCQAGVLGGDVFDFQSCNYHVLCPRYLTEWNSWGTCSNSCKSLASGPYQYRSRSCVNAISFVNNYFDCSGKSVNDQQLCNQDVSCPVFWSQWSEWYCCNASLTSRSRNCSNTDPLVCLGNNTEIKTCIVSFIGIELNVTPNQQQFKVYNTTVKIFYCNNVQLTFNFGDGTPVENIKNINASTEKGYTYTTMHSYSSCQKYTLTTNVFETDENNSSTLFTNSTNITVFCLLSPLKVVKTPPDSLNGYVQLSLNKNITLGIYQETGSNLIYSIDWGDGNSTINNQTMNSVPVSFQVQHMYTSINNYTISVTCRSYIQTLTPIFIQVRVTNCSMPEVYFYYGTVFNPMTIIKSFGRDLTAYVDDVSLLCKSQTFTFEWNLTSYDLKTLVTKQKGVIYQKKATFSIAKNSLIFGVYILSLQCNYGNISAVYTAYLNVIFSPLYIAIDNGLFVSVAYKKIISKKSFFHNFKVSASSYDPDDATFEIQNIIFKWRCKIASNFSDAKAAMDNFKLLNPTFFSDSCFNETWIEIPSIFSEIVFNTQEFLADISYHIEVCGTKYAEKDVFLNGVNKTNCFVQEVFISESLPTVSLKAIHKERPPNRGKKEEV